MAFSMHSHSGQFCPGHAKDALEEVVLRAIALKMRLLALTEHMPRDQDQDLYPEEVEAESSPALLLQLHDSYMQEAIRLREKYRSQITILVGFEGEWIRPSSAEIVKRLLQIPGTDFFIGSVHHVHEIPIDFDRVMYEKAREAAGGTDRRLFEDYFDAQHDMLLALRPLTVGHLDLIRLFSEDPDQDLKNMPGVWKRIVRNLTLIRHQGGLVEVNSSALRKGLREPYPSRSICEEFLKLGGKLTLSDDSHGVTQVGLNFGRVIAFLEGIGVESLYYLSREYPGSSSLSASQLQVVGIPLTEVVI